MNEREKKLWRDRLWECLTRHIVRAPVDITVFLGDKIQKTSMFAAVRTAPLWREEPFLRKLKSIFTLRWRPQVGVVEAAATEIFLDEVFGAEEDFGPSFLRLLCWHSLRKWDLDDLTDHDRSRVEALEAYTVLTRLRFSGTRSIPPLNLELATRNPMLPLTAIPMIAKIPVISFQFFLEVHATFAFNAIRRSGHEHADALVSYLYELLFLQQKIAIALHEFVRLSAYAHSDKKDAVLLNAEVEAIMSADLIFTYLKASLEKTVAMVGLTFGIANLESKKTHKSKYAALKEKIPEILGHTPYGEFFLEYVKSENLEELNSYRSGLLHKRGIADLQPHNYALADGEHLPFFKIFSVLHEQHAKNTAVLLCGLALLTDLLVELDPPDMTQEDLRGIFSPDQLRQAFSFHIDSVPKG